MTTEEKELTVKTTDDIHDMTVEELNEMLKDELPKELLTKEQFKEASTMDWPSAVKYIQSETNLGLKMAKCYYDLYITKTNNTENNMTQEEKDLLLKDICARLPHGVKVQVCNIKEYAPTVKGLLNDELYVQFDYITKPIKNGDSTYNIINDNIKPYLRPMSNMTEEELKDLLAYSGLIEHEVEICKYNGGAELEFWLSEVPCKCVSKVIDWLNNKMFDYRGLIPMNLALPAKEGMYNF